MKLWFSFEKIDKMKYISYLDLLNVFARAIKRAGIEPAMSKGFNPQPKVSFAQPLPLGVNSLRDYGELEIVSKPNSWDMADMISGINKELPKGFNIFELKEPEHSKPPKLMSLVVAADYRFNCSSLAKENELVELCGRLKKGEDLYIDKWHKKRKEYVKKNITPMIYQIKTEGQDIYGTFQAGSSGNLRPDDFISALLNDQKAFTKISCDRLELFCENNKSQKNLIPLWEWDRLNVNVL
ncbi:TIGR03936 family radical SAM-associated protein [Natranaerobius thermophilus]|uniref:DUF2344 domain-containing protein n=1 Tax=Natranaerobius thermophilus (strain ATCC BAA-1301 / DSM 18059 / JW/NM-WN-LF) TaxID=457570 RepID=B2A6B1_NATTJ|nr:TIGR03936 family radical SAM-associated protein [Natranaerobius thermophilus]ACB84122.1 conserved hypothetical protein [Natranaerobius thermophilus JW/NM-WN-LF]